MSIKKFINRMHRECKVKIEALRVMVVLAMYVLGVMPVTAYSQTCNDSIVKSTPSSHFINNENGTLSDETTGLMWAQCSEGQSGEDCIGGSIQTMRWDDALEAVQTANANNFLGYDDWRLPNVKELLSLVEDACSEPAINKTLFPNTKYNQKYWTSSPSARNDSGLSAWSISFHEGGASPYESKGHNQYVRFVRTVTLSDDQTTIFNDDFDSSDTLTNLWAVTTPGDGSSGKFATYNKANGKLTLSVSDASDGFMGVGDTTLFSPKTVVLTDDFYIETNLTELSRSRNGGYKDNSGLDIHVQNNAGEVVAVIGVRGEHSGYFPGYAYDEYQGHRIQGTNNYLKELDLGTLYNLYFRVYRTANKLYIGYKLAGDSSWTDTLIKADSVDTLKPFLRIHSGDGGRTRQNGNFSGEVDYFKITPPPS